MNKVKEFLSKAWGIVTLVITALLGVIYFLVRNNSKLQTDIDLNDTRQKDKELSNEIDKLQGSRKEEEKLQGELKDQNEQIKKEAENQDPEDFWKKH